MVKNYKRPTYSISPAQIAKVDKVMFDERAGILEYDAKYSRMQAEMIAYRSL